MVMGVRETTKWVAKEYSWEWFEVVLKKMIGEEKKARPMMFEVTFVSCRAPVGVTRAYSLGVVGFEAVA